MKRTPILHREVPLGTRVLIPKNTYVRDFFQRRSPDKDRKGVVVGITYMDVFFIYIVLLDEEFEITDEYGVNRAVGVPGQSLCELDGTPFSVTP